jgi:outer membrane protein assembly factor BamA
LDFAKITFLCLLFLLVRGTPAIAQESHSGFNDEVNKKVAVDSTAKIYMSAVNITGNKKTKNYIILREMRMKPGDSILASTLLEKLELSRQLIYNTTLFTEVVLVPRFSSATDMIVDVTVTEKWYIYPTPQFQLVDRNLNEWLNTYNADLERVIYGAKFSHYNLSGRRDQLRVFLLTGYARNFSFVYSAPYSNRALTEGFSVGAGYTQNREIIYKTSLNNGTFRYKSDRFARNTFVASGAYLIRRGFYKRHLFSVGYTHTSVEDSVITNFNPKYFNQAKSKIGYPDIGYTFQYIHTNNIQYPLTGKIYGVSVFKRGFDMKGGVNMLSMDATYNRYLSHGKNWYSSFHGYTKVKLPFTQAYINQRALGYGDLYLRGLEDYVIDGVATFLGQYTLKKKILSFSVPVPIKNKIVPRIPFTIFAKSFADGGYAYNKAELDTRLGNRLLYTGGFGLDVLTLYDINLKIEYSFNQLGEKGLFLHMRGGF